MTSSEIPLKIGTILYKGERRYKIVNTLGQGGFGITYLAVGEVIIGNVPTEAKFAIKEHFPSSYSVRNDCVVAAKYGKTSDYDKSKADFISEANKLHALGTKNDNIVKVNEVFEENGTAYYVMQYINGMSLSEYVKAKKCLTYSEAINILSPIFNAVEFLHKSRINHLDIKPDNIMLHDTQDGKIPVIIDFGLSIHFKKNGDKTSPKGVMGVSEGYSPLEQYAGIKEFIPATDVYALAATLIYAITGATPKSASELKISEVRTNLNKLVPPDALDAICRALNKSYEDRTQTVSTFKSDLGILQSGHTVPIPVPDDDLWKKVIIGLISIIAIVALCVIFNKWWREHEIEPNKEGDIQVVDPPVPVAPVVEVVDTSASTRVDIEHSDSKQETSEADKPNTGDKKENPIRPQSHFQNSHPTPDKVETATTGTLSLGYATWNGGIKNGKPEGKGILTFTSTHKVDKLSSVMANSGDYFEATYSNGILEFGKLYDCNGNLKKTIIP